MSNFLQCVTLQEKVNICYCFECIKAYPKILTQPKRIVKVIRKLRKLDKMSSSAQQMPASIPFQAIKINIPCRGRC